MAALTKEQVRANIKARQSGQPIPFPSNDERTSEQASIRMTPPSGPFAPFPMILPPVESDIPDQKSAYQRQQDIMTEFYNSLLGFGVPSKVLSMVGVEAPQERVEEARSRLPGEASMAAQTLGSIPTAIATAPLAFRGVSSVPVLSGTIAPVRAGIATGLEGLLSYYGLTSRGKETPGGAAISTLAGPVFTTVGTPIAKAVEFASRPARERALRTIGDLMAAPRGPSATALTADELAIIAGEPKPITVAEQIGGEAEGLEPLVERAVQTAGPEGRAARDIAIEKMTARAEGRPTRVFESAEGFPTSQRVDELMENIELDKTEAGQIYDKAYDVNFGAPDEIVTVLNGDSFKKSAKGAITQINDQIASGDIKPITVFKTVTIKGKKVKKRVSISEVDLRGTKNIKNTLETTENPTMVVDYMLRGLDDRIAKSKKPGERRNMLNLKYKFLDEINEVNPNYIDARNTYSGAMSRQNSIEFGRDILNLKDDEFKTIINKMSQDEKEYFSVGAMEFIKEELSKPNLGALKNIKPGDFENKVTRRLRFAFPSDDAYTKFASNLQDEINMLDLEKTGRLSLEQSEGMFNNLMSALYVRQRPGAGPQIFVNISNAVRRLTGGGMGADEASEVVDILLANTPSERTAVLDDLVRSEKISKIVADEVQESLSTFTAPLTVTTAAGVSPNED